MRGTVPDSRNGPETRQKIIDKFSEFVAEHGFEIASVSMLSTALGISKGTVVHHFPAKNLIMAEAHMQYMERRVREMYRVLEVVSEPEYQLAAMMYAIVRAHRDDRPGTISFLREQARFPFGGDVQAMRTLRNEFTAIMTGILRRGQLTGAFGFTDLTVTAMQIFGTCNYVWTWLRLDEPATVEDVSAEFASNTLRGLCAKSEHGDRFAPRRLLSFFGSLTSVLEPFYPPDASSQAAVKRMQA
ncbi:TetR family transcriptional regulator [Dactylosporangium sp. CA-233914]|uniref:TetR family transcriptional regulator n=1 Tax=Dactylosporangium sp. CA-233914 TaxID=3239934 RepID=UPI003D8B5675